MFVTTVMPAHVDVRHSDCCLPQASGGGEGLEEPELYPVVGGGGDGAGGGGGESSQHSRNENETSVVHDSHQLLHFS